MLWKWLPWTILLPGLCYCCYFLAAPCLTPAVLTGVACTTQLDLGPSGEQSAFIRIFSLRLPAMSGTGVSSWFWHAVGHHCAFAFISAKPECWKKDSLLGSFYSQCAFTCIHWSYNCPPQGKLITWLFYHFKSSINCCSSFVSHLEI